MQTVESAAEPVLVWGGGAIGGSMAAWWARAGVPVTLVDTDQAHVEACRTRGLAIEGPVDQFTQVIPSVTPDGVSGVFRKVVLAVKALATESATRALLPHLAADGAVLSAQNGLNEVAIARLAGEQRTIGCFVNFAADVLEPGRILFGSRGALVLGELSGPPIGRTRGWHALLQLFDPGAVLTDNIWGHLWGKLGYLSMVYATALTDEPMLQHFSDPQRAPVFAALAREVVAVARARGVVPVGFGGFDPAAFAPGAPPDATEASLEALRAIRRRSAKTHSGIWRDLSVRKRRTEVDSQIGLVAEMGAAAGVPTPLLRTLAGLIHDIEDGRRPQHPSTFAVLGDTWRQNSTSAAR